MRSSSMANPTSSAASSSGVSGGTAFDNWKSPIPYLFCGIALMLGLVAVALLILACSYRKTLSSTTSEGGDENGDQGSRGMDDIEKMETKILVIMAGEKTPTFLANPI